MMVGSDIHRKEELRSPQNRCPVWAPASREERSSSASKRGSKRVCEINRRTRVVGAGDEERMSRWPPQSGGAPVVTASMERRGGVEVRHGDGVTVAA
jgi:hypothetical protein